MPDPGVTSRTERRAIIRDGLGVGIATGLYGVSFGAVSVAAGLSVLQTCVLSLVMFTGASQFALVGVVAAGGAPLSGAADRAACSAPATPSTACKLAPLLRLPRLAAAAGGAPGHRRVDRDVGDPRLDAPPPGSASSAPASRSSRCGTSSRFGGAIAGNLIGDPRTYGLDAAVGAAFLALLWPRLADRRNRVVAACAAAVALGVVPFTAGRRTGARRRRRRPAGRPAHPRRRRRDGDPRPMTWWWAILGAGIGCYLLKLAGLSVPAAGARAAPGRADRRPDPGRAALRAGRRPGVRAAAPTWPSTPGPPGSPPPWSRCCCARRSSSWSSSPPSPPRCCAWSSPAGDRVGRGKRGRDSLGVVRVPAGCVRACCIGRPRSVEVEEVLEPDGEAGAVGDRRGRPSGRPG